jgi:hypothetical protein
MRDARRSGKAQATRVRALNGRRAATIARLCRIFIAVYESPPAGTTATDSTRACRGFVSAVFRVQPMIQSALGSLELAGVDVSFFEVENTGDKKLIRTRWSRARPESEWDAPGLQRDELAAFDADGFMVSHSIDVGGLRWWVKQSPPTGVLRHERRAGLAAGDAQRHALSVVGGYITPSRSDPAEPRGTHAPISPPRRVVGGRDLHQEPGWNHHQLNRAAERLLGYSAGGHREARRPDSARCGSAGTSRLVEPRDNETRTRQYETVRIAKDGRSIDVSLSVSPIRNDRGDISRRLSSHATSPSRSVDRLKTTSSTQRRTNCAPRFGAAPVYGHAARRLRGEPSVEQRDYLRYRRHQHAAMVDPVGTLLNISRIDSAALMVRPVPSYLGELLLDVLNGWKARSRASAYSSRLTWAGLPLVLLDPVIVHEILINPLTNAVRYTPRAVPSTSSWP